MQATQNLPQVTVRAARNRTQGVRTFYIGSASQPGLEYAVQFIRRSGMKRWQCTCPHFFYRCAAKKRHCKHLRLLAAMARLLHGVSSLTIMGVRRES